MTNEEPITDQQLDAYLDGLLKPEEREEFEDRLRESSEVVRAEIVREIELQARIDATLGRLFPLQHVPEAGHEELMAQTSPSTQVSPIRLSLLSRLGRKTQAAIVGLAATCACIIVAWQLEDNTNQTPYFQPKPVALVYQEVVDNGFEPYYECREEDRFAATFLRRQGQALRLAALPDGSQMLGLSYAGGLSRDTTAMLCHIDDQPVMVFVDRLENDRPNALLHEAREIEVHRVARDGLVFYEVTPFDAARVIDHLVAQE